MKRTMEYQSDYAPGVINVTAYKRALPLPLIRLTVEGMADHVYTKVFFEKREHVEELIKRLQAAADEAWPDTREAKLKSIGLRPGEIKRAKKGFVIALNGWVQRDSPEGNDGRTPLLIDSEPSFLHQFVEEDENGHPCNGAYEIVALKDGAVIERGAVVNGDCQKEG